MAKYSQAQNKAVQKYTKEHLDRLYVTVPKGKKEEIQAAADNVGESLNGYIKKSIDMRMESEKDDTGE